MEVSVSESPSLFQYKPTLYLWVCGGQATSEPLPLGANIAWIATTEKCYYSVRLLKPSTHRHKNSKPRGFQFLCMIICANGNRGCLSWLLVVKELWVREGLDGKESTAALFKGQHSFYRAFLNFASLCLLPQVWDVWLSHEAGLDPSLRGKGKEMSFKQSWLFVLLKNK